MFDHPANLFVAGFIGTPQMNFFDAKLKKEGEKYLVSVGGYQVELSPAKCANLVKQGVTDQDITLGVRPNHIVLRQEGSSIPAKVDVFEMMGNEIHLHVTAEGKDVVIIVPTMDLTGNYTEAFSAGKDLAFPSVAMPAMSLTRKARTWSSDPYIHNSHSAGDFHRRCFYAGSSC